MAGPLVSSPFPYFKLGSLTYIPLVNQLNEWRCDLRITAMVPFEPGNRGDHDNRQKTIFDSLRLPQRLEQVVPTSVAPPADGLVFCLVEDDSMIGNCQSEWEPLLTPIPAASLSEPNYVSLAIGVTLSDCHGGPIRVAGAP
jgi:hypothetical protein